MFQIIDQLSTATGVQVDLLKTIFALVASFIFSPLYRIFTSRAWRNYLSIVLGFSFVYFIIEEWAFFILGSILIPFYLLRLTSKPFLASVVCSLLLLLIVHGYRFVKIYSVWRVDCSVYIMLLVTKLTYYAKWLQKKQKDKQQISIVDFLGYNFYFSGVIAGPTFNFQIYLDFVNNKYDTSFKSLNLLIALQPFFISIPLLLLGIVAVPYFHTRWVFQNEFYLSLNVFSKIVVLNFIGFFYRLKYYVGWYFAQGATNLSGLSVSASGQYDSVVVVSLKFETQQNARTKVQYWNTSNQQWLKNVVFQSVGQSLGQNAAFLGTFMISAYWHGLYLTYYIGFLQWGMFMHFSKWLYKWSIAYPKIFNSLPSKILTFIVCSSFLNYIGMFMAILNWEEAVAFHADIYYCGTIALFVLVALTFAIRPPREKKKE